MISELNTVNLLDRILKVQENDIRRCERKGQELGKENIPEAEAESLSSFESEEKSKIDSSIKSFLDESDQAIAKIEEKKEEIVRKLDIQIPKMLVESDERHQTEIDNYTKILGSKSKDFQEVKLKYQEAQSELKSIKNSVNNRPLNVQFVQAYIPFMAVLALAELQINRLAFELFFESSPLISYLLAAATGAVLIFFAHITGTSIKKSQSTEVDVNKSKSYISMTFLNVFVFIFIMYLSLMRQNYTSLLNYESSGGIGSEIDSLMDTGETPGLEAIAPTEGVLGSLLSISLGKEGFFLLLQNIAIYLCGFFAAFIRHDTHPNYEIAENKYNKLRKEFFKVQKEYDLKLAELDKNQVETQSNISKEREQSEQELFEIDQEINRIQNLREEYKNKANAVLRQRISVFRKANINSRSASPPKYFKEKVTLNA